MKKMKKRHFLKVRVGIPQKAYDVFIGPGAASQLPAWLKTHASKRVFVICDERLVEARARVRRSFEDARWEYHEFPVQAGEGLKKFETLYPLYGKLLSAKAGRDSLIVALGGGSVGDAAGFLAATYLRGINWIGVPTSLLAQVDSSVGGKTGINHEMGKNLIGAFHQPLLVACDTRFLNTLSEREIISGLGEIFKYGIVYDPVLFKYLAQHWKQVLALDQKAMTRGVSSSLHWKAKAVAHDEKDRKGVREILNFGHTFGHALEAETHFTTFQHGEAVIWGMRLALHLSNIKGQLKSSDLEEIDGALAKLPIPPIPQPLDLGAVLRHMANDKKVRHGKLHFVLLRKLGKTYSDATITDDELKRALDQMGVKLRLLR